MQEMSKASAPTNDGVDQPAVDGSNPAGSASGDASNVAASGADTHAATSPASSSVEGYGEGLSAGAGGSPEGATETDTPSGHRFTKKASECSHRTPTDDWVATVQIDGQPRCSLCGTPAVRYREAS